MELKRTAISRFSNEVTNIVFHTLFDTPVLQDRALLVVNNYDDDIMRAHHMQRVFENAVSDFENAFLETTWEHLLLYGLNSVVSQVKWSEIVDAFVEDLGIKG